MKRVTASEARRNWFRLLDEVAAGETVFIERAGRRILIQRESERRVAEPHAEYSAVIRATDAENAHRWSWEWSGPEGEIRPSPPGDEA